MPTRATQSKPVRQEIEAKRQAERDQHPALQLVTEESYDDIEEEEGGDKDLSEAEHGQGSEDGLAKFQGAHQLLPKGPVEG